MEKPNKKLKKFLMISGITGLVYAGFKYLLPLVIPFLAALFLAALLRPSVLWLEKRCRITVKERTFAVPAALLAAVELIVIFFILGTGMYAVGRKLWQEAVLFVDNFPAMIHAVDKWLTYWCRKGERFLGCADGMLVRQVQDMLRFLVEKGKTGAMPFMVVNSMAVLKAAFSAMLLFIVIFLAEVMFIQEMETFQNYLKKSIFREEYAMLRRLLTETGRAYVWSQLVIMTLTAGICVTGLCFLGNPYFGLLGVMIGLLDALPLLGTGTIFLPWAAFCFLTGKADFALGLLTLYLICYFMREVLEAKLMGGKVGLSPLQTLAAVYIGIRLFGFTGFLLGPVGFLIIRGAAEIYLSD